MAPPRRFAVEPCAPCLGASEQPFQLLGRVVKGERRDRRAVLALVASTPRDQAGTGSLVAHGRDVLEWMGEQSERSNVFCLMPILSGKGLLAIAAVVDVALQPDGQPVSAKVLAARHGYPSRHLEATLQALVREGILKGIRGPFGGYLLARDPGAVTANDILRAAQTVEAEETPPKSDLLAKVLPVLTAVEQECGQAFSRISLDDIVHAAVNGRP
jgi:Rrf2 family protein